MVWVWRRKIWPISGLFYPVLSHFQFEESWVLYMARNIHAYWMVWKCFGACLEACKVATLCRVWRMQMEPTRQNVVFTLNTTYDLTEGPPQSHLWYVELYKVKLILYAWEMLFWSVPPTSLHPFFCSTASTGCTIFAMRSSHFSPYLKLVNCTVCSATVLPKCLHTCSDHCSH
jgi:hypothetical protein